MQWLLDSVELLYHRYEKTLLREAGLFLVILQFRVAAQRCMEILEMGV